MSRLTFSRKLVDLFEQEVCAEVHEERPPGLEDMFLQYLRSIDGREMYGREMSSRTLAYLAAQVTRAMFQMDEDADVFSGPSAQVSRPWRHLMCRNCRSWVVTRNPGFRSMQHDGCTHAFEVSEIRFESRQEAVDMAMTNEVHQS